MRRRGQRVLPLDEVGVSGAVQEAGGKDALSVSACTEQVFMTQTEHVSLRSQCLEYMTLHKESSVVRYLEVPVDHHVYKLQDVREWGGHTEIIAMAQLFKVDFLIYQEIGNPPTKATEYNYPKTLMLSFTHGNHYDIVYKKEAAMMRGFCQSLVYEILYSNVFQLKDVRLAVDTMLHDKEYASLRRDSANSAELKEIGALVEKILGTSISRDSSQEEVEKTNTAIEERPSMEDIHPDDVRGLLAHGIPPFPYKVAKSLDPDIYRNIEYDAWNTIRREARYGPIDYNGFQAGVKVFIKLELLPNRGEVQAMRQTHMARQGTGDSAERKSVEEKVDIYQGHIQEMSENKGPVDVYIEEIGCRLKVPYESLERIPPSPPRSPWHQQGGGGAAGGPSGAGGSAASYKKLSGYYQKAPLPPEPEYSAGRSKKKGGKQVREVVTVGPIPSARFFSPVNNCGMRGRGAGSPTPPRPRTPQGPHHQPPYGPKGYPQRGMGRGSSGGYRGAPSPAREAFPPFPSGMNVDMGVEGVWAQRANSGPANHHSGPKSAPPFPCMPHPPLTHPPPPYGDKDPQLHVREVTMEALHQVMSAGGQQVRVTGQQLEVVFTEKIEESRPEPAVRDNVIPGEHVPSVPQANEDVNGTTPTADGELSRTSAEATELPTPPQPLPLPQPEVENTLHVEPLNQTLISQEPNGEVPQPLVYPGDPSIAFISPPPPAHMPPTQLGDSPSPHSATVYTVTYPPPYASPGLIQVYSPVPHTDGSCTPSEYNSPPPQPLPLPPSTPTTPAPAMHARPEAWDPSGQGADPEAMKMNPGASPYMVYQMPMMYGGYGGYGYNPQTQWGYNVPVMPSPTTIEESKQPPLMPGPDGYHQMVTVGGWGQGYVGDMPPQPVLCPPPPPQVPKSEREDEAR
ncbi:Protein ovarian tumor locus [Chionoecetes opilio]|uniref:Protein ovarian tumor locus n=1 Tax=Chionoecetes opilio TaxID=41210 RepID=A0A8J4XV27_CHIOP|nr:Protein ovarian tumor locus [Chionoecetes opilio]